MYHSFGSMHFHSQLDISNSWTDFASTAIGKVDEMAWAWASTGEGKRGRGLASL